MIALSTTTPVTFLGDRDFMMDRSGSKAANLHRLSLAGFRVPPGFVVDHSLDPEAISDASLAAAVDRIGGFPVAVRSSSVLEDLPNASFAGQYDTFLNVSGIAALREALTACRASAQSARARAYRRKVGLDDAAALMSILVQRMVDAVVAGVAFSIQPLTGREEHAYVECCAGLGEALVSGHVTPSRLTVDLETGGIVEEELGSQSARLSDPQVRDLASMLLRIQALCGCPQDVEWAIDGTGTLFTLQSRPISRLSWRSDIDEFTNADMKDGGISANVCTPHMYSLYHRAFQRSMQAHVTALGLARRGTPERWIASYYGRGYWNASAVKRALSRVPGFDEEKFDRDLGIQKDYGASGPLRVAMNLQTIVPAIPVALALARSYKEQTAAVKAFTRRMPAELRAIEQRLGALSQLRDEVFFSELERIYFEVHAHTEETYFTTICCNSNAQTDFKSFIAKMDSVTGRTTSLIELLGGLANVHHMDMQRGMCRLYRAAAEHGSRSAELDRELTPFLEEHGFHADAELDITVPRWRERPDRVRALVEAMLRTGTGPADPETMEKEQRRRFEAERDAVESTLRSRLLWRMRFLRGFRSQLTRVRAFLSLREQMRKYSTQVYAIVRAYSLEAGRRLRRQRRLPRTDAVFMLWTDEVIDLCKGRLTTNEALRRVEFRRLMYEGYRSFTPPNELGLRVEARSEASYVRKGEGSLVLSGLGCSAGVIEGTARVIRSLDEIQDLRKGDILVTKFTDPGWTPALGLVAGVVTEVGGLLSHAAVIGREYGLPAVLNLPGATKALRSGQRIRVDGSRGTVELLEA